ncbi:lysozyme [Flavobacterium sp.]|jgi:lysozyme|uniref:lysozyme n=1 Tax=Flavobacterium sp. TaxID=239 RepID=UPI0037BEED59
MTPSDKCYDLIKSFEGCKLKAYPDPGTHAEPWTIGYGTTKIDGKPVPHDLTITQEQANHYLQLEVDEKAKGVNNLLKVDVTQSQFDALVSFAYNCGLGNLEKSSLLRYFNAGNSKAAADEFLKWNKAAGQVMSGLTRRREAERTLFLL